jgi:hypothetical protein
MSKTDSSMMGKWVPHDLMTGDGGESYGEGCFFALNLNPILNLIPSERQRRRTGLGLGLRKNARRRDGGTICDAL